MKIMNIHSAIQFSSCLQNMGRRGWGWLSSLLAFLLSGKYHVDNHSEDLNYTITRFCEQVVSNCEWKYVEQIGKTSLIKRALCKIMFLF